MEVLFGAAALLLLVALAHKLLLGIIRFLMAMLAIAGFILLMAGLTGALSPGAAWAGGALLLVAIITGRSMRRKRPAVRVSAQVVRRADAEFSSAEYAQDAAKLAAASRERWWRARSAMEEARLDCAWQLLHRHTANDELVGAEQSCRQFLREYAAMPPAIDSAQLASEISGDVPSLMEHYLALASGVDSEERRRAALTIGERIEALASRAREARAPEIERHRAALAARLSLRRSAGQPDMPI